MHNGQIGNFVDIRRELEAELSDDLYLARQGSTDSELFFLLALNYGLARNQKTACEAALDKILESLARCGYRKSVRIACVFSNGGSLFGLRYSSDAIVPTLYHSKALTHGGFALASEPLDSVSANWHELPRGSFFCFHKGKLTVENLNLSAKHAT